MRANLDRSLTEIQRLQGNSGEREGQRRGILVALGQNDCGPQYRQYANSGPGGFFENLFGGGGSRRRPDAPLAGTYRTLCVRTCDGYYFPISYSTVPGKFADDEQLCRRLCPAAEVTLYSHRNPGEDVARAVSTSGRSYSELPNAFSYRKQYNAACQCRAPGQSWADALRQGQGARPDRGTWRYRRHRGAGEADVAAALRRAGQTGQARPRPPGTRTLSRAPLPSRQPRPKNRPPPPRRRRPTRSRASARFGRSDRPSTRCADGAIASVLLAR